MWGSAGTSCIKAVPWLLRWSTGKLVSLKPVRCAPAPIRDGPPGSVMVGADPGILCEPCQGSGWLVCDFCKGQKTNVTAENKRIYRRCPSCRATGYLLCSQCKVFKCVTFPDYDDVPITVAFLSFTELKRVHHRCLFVNAISLFNK